MKSTNRPRSLHLCLVVGTAALLACNPKTGSNLLVDGSADTDGGTIVPTSLAIMPATAMLQVTDPTMLPTLALTAVLQGANNSTEPTTASWTVDRFDIASVDASSGVLTAAGSAYGLVTVTAATQGFTATAKITVQLASVVNTASASTA